MTKVTAFSDDPHLPAHLLPLTCGKIIPMTILFFLIAISLGVAVFFLGAFFWAVSSGQYEDEYTPSVRMLLDDEKASQKEAS